MKTKENEPESIAKAEWLFHKELIKKVRLATLKEILKEVVKLRVGNTKMCLIPSWRVEGIIKAKLKEAGK